jgi:hypothetical protein
LFRRRQSHTASHSESGQVDAKHPLIISITSDADSATGSLFPIGTTLSNIFGMFRKYEWDTRYGESSHNVPQRDYFTHTPGHNPRLTTLTAQVIAGTASLPKYEYSETCSPEQLEGLQANLREPLTGPAGEVRFVTLGAAGEKTMWQLEPASSETMTPYWIVRVPREIIRDHSDIFNENALAMMARLFRVSNPQAERGLITTPGPRKMYLADPGGGAGNY